jgi:hypothetical protein
MKNNIKTRGIKVTRFGFVLYAKKQIAKKKTLKTFMIETGFESFLARNKIK